MSILKGLVFFFTLGPTGPNFIFSLQIQAELGRSIATEWKIHSAASWTWDGFPCSDNIVVTFKSTRCNMIKFKLVPKDNFVQTWNAMQLLKLITEQYGFLFQSQRSGLYFILSESFRAMNFYIKNNTHIIYLLKGSSEIYYSLLN